MADKTTNGANDKEIVDAASVSKAADPISKATLVMIAATVIFIIIAGIIIGKVFFAPTGVTGSGSLSIPLRERINSERRA